MTYSDVNPSAPVTKAEAAQKALTRITYRFAGEIRLLAGIAIGYLLSKF